MKIFYENAQFISSELLTKMEAAAKRALELENVPEERTEISVTFVDMDVIHRLNLEYRNVDSPTDVLSFPQFEADEEIPSFGDIILGDVVICMDKAEAQAKEFGHSVEREIVYLFTHSILHLLGYDHMEEDEKKVMRAREEEIMDYLGIPRRQ